ncbi:MAG TPA: ATP-binding cassette domain-containing protein [Thermoanaerobaculia bacterium]|nr:ATP-binding cassette domain-containing protein [Thermoanaerobaculia bacterium]
MVLGAGDSPPVLRGIGLRKSFGSQTLFESLDIELRPGELVLLRGENGAGKTTLIDLLTGNQRADHGRLEVRQASGTTCVVDARRTDPTTLARLGIVKCWQRPQLFWTQTVRDNLKIAAAGAEDSAPRVLARALHARRDLGPAAANPESYLADLGLEALVGRCAMDLSFGQSRRLSIALSAIVGTRALLLDEPLASLDKPGTRTVNQLLGQLTEKRERAVLVVEHALNERLLAGLDYRVLELRSRRLDHGESRPAAHPEAGTPEELWTRTVESATGLRCQGPAEPLGDGGLLLRFRSRPPAGSAPLLVLERLRVRRGAWDLFTAERGLGEGVSMTVRAGEVAVLLARNGWGKSSLAKAIAGELPVTSGRVLLGGQPVSAAPSWIRRRQGLLYSETATALFTNLTVQETLSLKKASGRLGTLKVSPRKEVRTLSGGERQRLALHCALTAPNGRVLVLDEPFNGLDREAATHWLGRLEAAALEGKALLVCLPA